MKRLPLLLIAVLLSLTISAQQWGMYTLYSGLSSSTTYLLDTASNTFKTWSHSSTNKSGYSSYMIEGDTLVRSYQLSSTEINGAAGATGGIQKVTWDGTIAWDWTYSSSTYLLHHDIHPMPNGNVLLICYDKRTSTEMTQAGSDDAQDVLSEMILEVKPTGSTTGEIVWQWVAWDHLCQDHDASKDNYVSSIVANPQLLNINYGMVTNDGPPKPPPGGDTDWLHMNGIDYNEELDQITFSSHNLNEIYVIDHSTTTAQAAGHSGGNAGMGGDILYRWGNPEAYGASGTANFDVVHDAHWVRSDHPEYAGCLAALNNEGGSGGNAAVDIIQPPLDGYNYTLSGESYGPSLYTHRFNSSYFSMGQSNSEQLPNGNMLLSIVSQGATYIYEVDSDGNSLWTKTISGSNPQAHRYEKCFIRGIDSEITPTATNITEGESITLNTNTTAITESSPTFTYNWTSSPAGFTSTDANPSVTPTETTTYYVTVTNDQSGCIDEVFVTITVDPVSAELNVVENEINIYPNPNNGFFNISSTEDFSYKVLTSTGSLICSGNNDQEIDLSHMSEGVYYVMLESKDVVKTEKLIIIK